MSAGMFLPLVLIAAALPAQVNAPAAAAAPVLQFQVATVKPSTPDEVLTIQIRGNRFAATGASVVDLLKYAYGVHARQIVDGPAWMESERFDIVADPGTEDRPGSDAMKSMVQALVADRFSLRMHRETRTLAAYSITVGPHGQRLTRSVREASGIPAVSYDPKGSLTASNASMTDLASFLQRYVMDRPVVNRTGVEGRYDLEVRWAPDQSQFNGRAVIPAGDAAPGPSVYTAFQEQLGLKLEAGRAPVDVLVVDRVEQPSAN